MWCRTYLLLLIDGLILRRGVPVYGGPGTHPMTDRGLLDTSVWVAGEVGREQDGGFTALAELGILEVVRL